ncbi:hypothetical protein CCH79_00017813 [Gambusia affinis]|uniref:Uncharacterized protein n=1 Tax=Gambusia affinis TaxID=33528 RepID=A0A315V4P4_GAMAF|nr:hypothetical protein CCH79_00017813 [Gambusia affinis]
MAASDAPLTQDFVGYRNLEHSPASPRVDLGDTLLPASWFSQLDSSMRPTHFDVAPPHPPFPCLAPPNRKLEEQLHLRRRIFVMQCYPDEEKICGNNDDNLAVDDNGKAILEMWYFFTEHIKEFPVTVWTLERLDPVVAERVPLETVQGKETFGALRTQVRTIPRVRARVDDEVTLAGEALPTVDAGVRHLTRVRPIVQPQLPRREERLSAGELSPSFVKSLMVIVSRLACKSFLAINAAIAEGVELHAQDELTLLTGTEKLRHDLCGQVDEVQQLLVLDGAVLLHRFPHECRHEPHRRNQQLQGGWRKRGA